MGDAISHGILPGLAIAFIISSSMGLGSMFFGACIAGLACNFCIEWLHTHTKLKEECCDGAGIYFLFCLWRHSYQHE